MCLELESIDEARILALNSILFQKKKATKNYNKKVKHIGFDEGDLVWKTILPIGIKSHKFGKWSPNWEGPYQTLFSNHLGNIRNKINTKYKNMRILK